MDAPERGVAPEYLPARAGYPRLVVSLPGRSAEELRTQMGEAVRGGADLVEVRLDRLPPEEVSRLGRVHEIPLTHEWVPVIATLRSKAEGGEGPDDAPSRRRILLQALEAMPFALVDLELARDLPMRKELEEAEGPRLAFVCSAHLPASTSTEQALRTLEQTLAKGDVGKVVLPATAERALSGLIPPLQRLRGRPFVFHTTGGAGALLRVLAPRLGMAWVYCGLPAPLGRSTAGPRSSKKGARTASRPPPVGDSALVEASQIPVDRMRRFIDGGPEAPWFAVVGRPISHSLSPELHGDFLEATRSAGLYVALEIASEQELASILPSLVALGLRGINVTRPYKLAAYRLAERRSENAVASGAVNTLVPLAAPKQGFSGHNTDVLALLRWWKDLEEEQGPLSRVLVVGTGGAARAAVLASTLLGARVSVLGRNPQEVRDLVAGFPPETVRAIEPGGGALPSFPLVVHATPVGQAPGTRLEVPLEGALQSGSLLVDLVYRPVEPTLKLLAEASGARYLDGMTMLVYQAAESFQLFTREEVPPEVLRRWLPQGLEVSA